MTRRRKSCEVFAALLLLSSLSGCGSSPSSAAPAPPIPAKVIATIPLGLGPNGVDVNSTTNRVYVANQLDGTVSVIDGGSNTVISRVTVGSSPGAVAVNPVTNKIYVANSGDATVTVIDGNTNNTTSVQVGTLPVRIGVNSVTNKIYVSNYVDATVTVIDGATNNTATVTVPATPTEVAINDLTNRIYILNWQNSSVTVLDGATNQISVVAVGGRAAIGIASDSTRNKIYVTCGVDNPSEVDIIDGATLSVTATHVNNPGGGIRGPIAVNPTTNKIYVADAYAVTVIDGATLAVSTFTPQVAASIALDPGINQIYVVTAETTVAVVDGTTNLTTILNLGFGGSDAAVNLVTHRVYVTIACPSEFPCRYNTTPGELSVIDAAH